MSSNQNMKLSAHLTPHSVLICLPRKDQALQLKDALEQAGYQVDIALSEYEAANLIEIKLPHVIITSSVFKDGDVVRLRRLMAGNKLIAETPVIALLPEKSERLLRPLQGYQWQAILIGRLDVNAVVNSVDAAVQRWNGASPYLRRIEEFNLSPAVTMRLPVEAVGRTANQIIFRSKAQINREAILRCDPLDIQNADTQLHEGVSLSGRNWTFNVFPFSQLRGPGRSWMRRLPMIMPKKKSSHVLIMESAQDTSSSFAPTLKAFGIQHETAANEQELVKTLTRRGADFSAVIIKELDREQRSKRTELANILLNSSETPTVFFVSKFSATFIDVRVRFLPYPLGPGQLLNALEMALITPSDVGSFEQEHQHGSVRCNIYLDVDILGLDEVGGVLLSPFPLAVGCHLEVDNDVLNEFFGSISDLRVVACKQAVDHDHLWQVYFARMTGGMSRLKYWQKITAK